MQRLLYSTLLYLLTPLVLLRLWWRGRHIPGYRARIAERFGHVPPLPGKPLLWVHAVSVGEALAAVPLIRALQQRYPDHSILVTTTTPTGAERVQAALGDTVVHRYAPYDLPGAVQRFLRRAQPRLALIMETELWPNLLHYCRRAGVPTLLVNARLSERSARGYGRFASLTRQTLRCLDGIAAQAQEDAQRFMALGGEPGRVQVTGNLKFDFELPHDLEARATALRSQWGAARPVWIAASTHEGEEQLILQAHRNVLAALPDALLVLVPRHPQRFNAVAELCRAQNFNVVRRSEGRPCDAATQIFLGDTMGELLIFYAASSVAFVGGSLVPTGGHNLLEPAALGLPLLTGPHTFNFAEITRLMQQAGAVEYVADAASLAARVVSLLTHADEAQARGALARQVVAANRGSLQRVMDNIESLLG